MPNCFQRTAGRCEAVTDASGIPSEPRTERKVGCAGFRPITRIRVPSKDGMRVVPQRYITPLSLVYRDKGVFIS